MVFLEALVAFALTMLVFATVATMIVETFLRLTKQRERDYVAMLKRLGTEVVLPRFEKLFPPGATDKIEKFVAAMRNNPGAGPASAAGGVRAQTYAQPADAAQVHPVRRVWRWLGNWLVPKELTQITPAQFAERLAGTDIGQAIYRQTREVADTLVKDLAQKMEQFGKAAGEYYARRAKLICMLVSIVVAFAANVDGLNVMRTYLADEKVRSTIIGQRDQIEQDFRKADADLKKAQDALKSAPNDTGAINAEAAARDTYNKSAAKVHALSEIGVPVGWNYYPFCRADIDNRCRTGKVAAFALWVFATLVTGVLMGLGAPFWYDMVQSLFRLLALLRSLGVGVAKEKPPESGAAAMPETEQPRTPVEVFRVAAEAADTSKLVAAGAGLRPLINRDGTVG